MAQDTLLINQEGTAFNAAYLFAIHVFQFDDIEPLAGSFFHIRQ